MGKNPGRNGAVRELRTVPCCNSTLTLPKPLAFLWEKSLGVTERCGSFVPYRAVILAVNHYHFMGKNPGRNGAVRELRAVPSCNSSLSLPKPLAFLWEKSLGVTERYGSFVPYCAAILAVNHYHFMGKTLGVTERYGSFVPYRPVILAYHCLNPYHFYGKNPGRNGAVRGLCTVPCCNSSNITA